jgi:hypothetical protein
MSHAVVGSVVEGLANFFLDHGAGAAAEAVHEIGEVVEHIGEAKEGLEAVKALTGKEHADPTAEHLRSPHVPNVPPAGRSHAPDPSDPQSPAHAKAAAAELPLRVEQQAQEDAAYQRELAALLRMRAADRERDAREPDGGRERER